MVLLCISGRAELIDIRYYCMLSAGSSFSHTYGISASSLIKQFQEQHQQKYPMSTIPEAENKQWVKLSKFLLFGGLIDKKENTWYILVNSLSMSIRYFLSIVIDIIET